MNKITKKILLYFLSIVIGVLSIGFVFISTFLNKIYVDQKYAELQKIAESINTNSINEENLKIDINVSGIVKAQNNFYLFGLKKNIVKLLPIDELKEKDITKINNKDKFLSYKKITDNGYICIFKGYEDIDEYASAIYKVLLLVFMISIILIVPISIFVGRKFWRPLYDLKEISKKIANDDFNFEINIHTRDEIEDLANSISRMAKKLELKYTMQSEFISNVTHDFKTPLSIIRSYSEAIKDEVVEGDEVKKFSLDIIEEVDRLNNLVYNILQLTKIKEGKNLFNIKEFNIIIALEDIIKRFSFICRNENKNVVLFIDDKVKDKLIFIIGDEFYLGRAIYNLIHNALKFSKNGDEVKIDIIRDEKGNITVSVKDNGEGIKREFLDSVWDRYFKNNDSGGMGLGLPIAKEVFKKHDFLYGVKSIYGKGAEFYFTVPKTKIKYK